MKIGLDISGGDFAPDANLDGVCLAINLTLMPIV
jgi:fatty acid/phospholipid biosynthesis enzyme